MCRKSTWLRWSSEWWSNHVVINFDAYAYKKAYILLLKRIKSLDDFFFSLCHYEPYTRWCVDSQENICARPIVCASRDILGYSYLRLLFVWKLIFAARLRSSFFSLLYPLVGIVTIFVCPYLSSYTNAHFKCFA